SPCRHGGRRGRGVGPDRPADPGRTRTDEHRRQPEQPAARPPDPVPGKGQGALPFRLDCARTPPGRGDRLRRPVRPGGWFPPHDLVVSAAPLALDGGRLRRETIGLKCRPACISGISYGLRRIRTVSSPLGGPLAVKHGVTICYFTWIPG